MDLMFNGDHTFQFQAVESVKRLSKEQFERSKEMKKELSQLNSKCTWIKDCLSCRDRTLKRQRISTLKKELARIDRKDVLY